ncbi:MAG: histidine kinase dimerization/phospho-acceptor domain-containing protein, partial [Erysipelotrichaceae bacterium]
MSLKKIWMLLLTAIAIIAILVNSFVLTSLTDRYFLEYLDQSYQDQVAEVITRVTTLLETNKNISRADLNELLSEEVQALEVYDNTGKLVMNCSNNHMEHNNSMMHDDQLKYSDNYQLFDNGEVIGEIRIATHKMMADSASARSFKFALICNTILSVLISIFIAIIVGYLISRKMSQALRDTQKLANDNILEENLEIKDSKIFEIHSIRESLKDLRSRLKIKQKNRKQLVDQLSHQTRTPLTILQTHLEGIEDGVLELDSHEFEICKQQISNIEAIISNVGAMIDAGIESDSLTIERFDLNELLKQITGGLKAQFKNKNINLILRNDKKIILESDKYKLSQVIYNIIINALNYTQKQGEVVIDYQLKDANVILDFQLCAVVHFSFTQF